MSNLLRRTITRSQTLDQIAHPSHLDHLVNGFHDKNEKKRRKWGPLVSSLWNHLLIQVCHFSQNFHALKQVKKTRRETWSNFSSSQASKKKQLRRWETWSKFSPSQASKKKQLAMGELSRTHQASKKVCLFPTTRLWAWLKQLARTFPIKMLLKRLIDQNSFTSAAPSTLGIKTMKVKLKEATNFQCGKTCKKDMKHHLYNTSTLLPKIHGKTTQSRKFSATAGLKIIKDLLHG